MNKFKLVIVYMILVWLLAGCSQTRVSHIPLDDVLLSANSYDITTVEGDANKHKLTYNADEATTILIEKMLSYGLITETESMSFLMDETLLKINDIGYFYCIQTYDTDHAKTKEHVTKTYTFYVNGYTGDIYQMKIGTDAKTYFFSKRQTSFARQSGKKS